MNPVSEAKLLSVIEDLNGDMDMDGILVQLPLPKHISDEKIILAIDPSQGRGWISSGKCGKTGAGNTEFYFRHTAWNHAFTGTL